MKNYLCLLVIVCGLCGLNANATFKECTGGKNSSSTLGARIAVDITHGSLELKQTQAGYEDAVGPYPFNAHSKAAGNFLEFSGGDPEQQEGYTFLVDPALLMPGTKGAMHVRLDSGIEGYIDSDYTCQDK